MTYYIRTANKGRSKSFGFTFQDSCGTLGPGTEETSRPPELPTSPKLFKDPINSQC